MVNSAIYVSALIMGHRQEFPSEMCKGSFTMNSVTIVKGDGGHPLV
jgi:hypothetical protein